MFTKLGGYWIPDNSALSHMIEKMIDREVGQPRNKVIELYEENDVDNIYIEMRVAGSEVEVLTNAVELAQEPHVGAFLKTGDVELEDVTKMSRGSFEQKLF